MKIKTGYYDDEISFAGFGSAHAVDYAPPDKPKKKRKFRVGFAIPKKPKNRSSSRGHAPKTTGVS